MNICCTSVKYSACMHAKLLRSCPSLCDPMDTGFAVCGSLQARILEWVAISFSEIQCSDLKKF